MSFLYTPGPWYSINIGTEDEPMMMVRAAPQHEVAICATGDSPQEMETANARLIAAAPELLDALKAALLNVRAQAIANDSIVALSKESWWVKANAVLAKAEWRESDS